MSHRPIRRALALAAVAALAVAFPAQAAGPTPVQVTSSSPYYDSGCTADGVPQGSTNYPATELETHLAVNPTNPDNVVVAYQQDRYDNGGSRGDVVSVSDDGGQTWAQVRVQGIAQCDGGIWPRGTDPWLSFAPNGRLYLVSQSFDDPNYHQALVVATSVDGGHTWSTPVPVSDRLWGAPHYTYDDKVTLTADPTDLTGKTAYLTWDRYSDGGSWYKDNNWWKDRFPFNGGYSSVWMSKTIDGGASWSQPAQIYRPGTNNYTTGPTISVLPDRSLVMSVATWFQSKGGSSYTTYAMLRRSTDGGKTWNNPVRGPRMNDSWPYDPVTSEWMRTGGGIAEVAVDRTSGALYLTWEDGGGSYYAGNALVSISANAGRTWSAPVEVDGSSARAFTPMVAVAPDGTVGVSFGSFRRSGDETSQWIATCSTGCTSSSSWTQVQVGGAQADGEFPMSTAPYARGLFLGDYSGFVADANGFHAAYGLPNVDNSQIGTDIWYSSPGGG